MDRLPPKHCKAPSPLDMRKQNLTWEERRSIITRLLVSVKPDGPDFKLGHRIITSTASYYHVSRITIKKVRQCALAKFRNPAIDMPKIDVKPAAFAPCGLLLFVFWEWCIHIHISCPPRCQSFNIFIELYILKLFRQNLSIKIKGHALM